MIHRARHFILTSIFDVALILLKKKTNLIGNITNEIGQKFKLEK